MMRNFHKITQNQKGAALPLVIVVVAILAIFSTSVFYLTSTNIRQTKYQENGIEAYYLARSGAELAFEILLRDNGEILGSLTDQLGPETVAFDNGTAQVSVTRFEKNNSPWIRIESVGTVEKGQISRQVKLEFNKENPSQIRWIN